MTDTRSPASEEPNTEACHSCGAKVPLTTCHDCHWRIVNLLDPTEASTTPPALDAERLATAMKFVGRRIPGTGLGAYADEVAIEYGLLEAEYERLKEESK